MIDSHPIRFFSFETYFLKALETDEKYNSKYVSA